MSPVPPPPRPEDRQKKVYGEPAPDYLHWQKELKAAKANGMRPRMTMADLRAIAELEARVERLERLLFRAARDRRAS